MKWQSDDKAITIISIQCYKREGKWNMMILQIVLLLFYYWYLCCKYKESRVRRHRRTSGGRSNLAGDAVAYDEYHMFLSMCVLWDSKNKERETTQAYGHGQVRMWIIGKHGRLSGMCTSNMDICHQLNPHPAANRRARAPFAAIHTPQRAAEEWWRRSCCVKAEWRDVVRRIRHHVMEWRRPHSFICCCSIHLYYIYSSLYLFVRRIPKHKLTK